MQRTFQAYLDISFGLGYWVLSGRLCRRTIRLFGNPAACRGHNTDLPAQAGRGPPVELRSITQQGGRSGSSSLGRPRGSLPWSIQLDSCLGLPGINLAWNGHDEGGIRA